MSLPPKSHIAILSKNTAWWILCDIAIWMAGHVSVPIDPTLPGKSVQQVLEHSDARLLFVGKLDGWDAIKIGVPQGLPMVGLPLCLDDSLSRWSDIVASNRPLRDLAPCTDDALATIVYTSSSTGAPKGVMLTFGAMSRGQERVGEAFALGQQRERMPSYLPVAHAMERACIEVDNNPWTEC